MKKILLSVTIFALFLFTTVTANATGTVKITGDIAKNQCLMIDVDWTADTYGYKGMDMGEAREIMYDKMWEKILPELVKKTRGYPLSYDKSQFVLVNENTHLITERPDGTFLYDVKLKLKFACGMAPAGTKPSKHSKKEMDKEFKYRFHSVIR